MLRAILTMNTRYVLGFGAILLLAGCCATNSSVVIPPTIISVSPVSNSDTTCPNSTVTATFDGAMNPATISSTTFAVQGPGTAAVAGVITYNPSSNTVTFTPSALLGSGVTYTATLTTGIANSKGIALAHDYSWTFTTAANGCNPPPSVTAITPAAGSATACPSAVIVATFNQPMNTSSINGTTFTLSPGVTGTVSHDASNSIFTLTPSASLAAGTTYTATISTGAEDIYGNFLPANYIWTFTTAANGCQPAPTITSVLAAAGATGVCPNKIVTAMFSQAMQGSTINAQTFTLTGPGATTIAGTVSYDPASNAAIFSPSASLPLNATFTATITTGVQDIYGNKLASNYVWTFATGANSCLPAAPPASVTPPSSATGICPNTVITATYAQAMNPITITTTDFTVISSGGTAIAGSITHDAANKVFTFTPTASLSLSTAYTVKITTAAQDAFGNAMASNYSWTFTTGNSTCVVVAGPPTVNAVTPLANALGACLNSVATATFSEAMNSATINTDTFTLSPEVSGAVTLDATDKVATFTPSANLAVSTTYTAIITTGAQSSGGTPLAANYTWSFTTSSQACQPPVALGTAANYGILGAATVTSTGMTVITGENLGLSPGSSVTGFPPGILTLPAIEDITDPIAAQAQLDATIAYNYMAGLPLGAALPSDLSGLTLTPGLYKNASAVALNSGTVTLDAQGNSNAVFIFQIGTTLTTIGGTQVLLTGGAQAANVYWQVGSAATLGTYSTFEGTIIALQSVTLETGATLVGRALALNGAVTMDTNLVTAP